MDEDSQSATNGANPAPISQAKSDVSAAPVYRNLGSKFAFIAPAACP